MSNVTIVNSTSNQFHADYDISKIFVFGNRYQQASFINGTGAQASFAAGTVVGRIAATGKITICDSTATDGSQFPIGILKTAITDLANAASIDANYCLKGDVVADKLVFSGAETLSTVVTVVDGDVAPTNTTYVKIMRDLIQALGIILVDSTELTGYDNQ